jgi:hypothetical protein
MSHTAYTALIVTVYHLGMACALLLSLFFCASVYALFLRKKKHRWCLFFLLFLLSFMACLWLAQGIFQKAPIGFEIVQVG